jgi:hypothetical protein
MDRWQNHEEIPWVLISKMPWVGGQFDTPIDRLASQAQQKEVRDESNPFSV